MRLRSSQLITFIFLLLVTGCRGSADMPDEIVPTQTQASITSESPPVTPGYPPPQSTINSSTPESYPSSETFLPIAAYPEPTALGTARAYPPPTNETGIDSGSEIKATDPQLVNLEQGKPTLVEFFNGECETCISMIGTIQSLEREYTGEVNFIYLDTEDIRNDRLMRRLNYRFAPNFFLLDGDGQVLESWIGQVEEAKFVPALNAALAPLEEE